MSVARSLVFARVGTSVLQACGYQVAVQPDQLLMLKFIFEGKFVWALATHSMFFQSKHMPPMFLIKGCCFRCSMLEDLAR